MERRTGRGLSPGAAIGPLHRIGVPSPPSGPAQGGRDPEEELARLERARRQVAARLEEQRRLARERLGEEQAGIFLLHRLLLEDRDYLAAIREAVLAGAPAGQGVVQAGERFAARFRALDDPALQARADDVEEVSRLLELALSGREEGRLCLSAPAILWARELSAGQLLALNRELVLGLCLSRGSAGGHLALLARAMELPAAAGIETPPDWEGRTVILDGGAGTLTVDPDAAAAGALSRTYAQSRADRARREEGKGLPFLTRDGRAVCVCANVGCAREAALAVERGAQGVGLFRTELLCLARPACPTEEEQFDEYRRAVEALGGRRLTLRTLDLGADKCPPWLRLEPAENPALGLRGLRLCLERPELLRPQLRAVLRAAALGPVSLMFPMVTGPEQVRRARALLEACRRELMEAGTPAGPVEVGVMVETPAAALRAEELAREVEFFSIGTNDLTQYTLAADRQDPAAAPLWDDRDPAVLELIGRTARAGRAAGVRVAVCGRLAADLTMTRRLLELGVEELSVPPADLLPLGERIRTLDLSAPER